MKMFKINFNDRTTKKVKAATVDDIALTNKQWGLVNTIEEVQPRTVTFGGGWQLKSDNVELRLTHTTKAVNIDVTVKPGWREVFDYIVELEDKLNTPNQEQSKPKSDNETNYADVLKKLQELSGRIENGRNHSGVSLFQDYEKMVWCFRNGRHDYCEGVTVVDVINKAYEQFRK